MVALRISSARMYSGSTSSYLHWNVGRERIRSVIKAVEKTAGEHIFNNLARLLKVVAKLGRHRVRVVRPQSTCSV